MKYIKEFFLLFTQLLRLSILIGFITFLTGCSSTRLLYTFLDTFIEDEVTYFLDLNKNEKLQLGQEVSEMVVWHKKNMLPKYASYLSNTADMIEMEKYGSSDISKILTNGQFLIEETVIGLTPYASRFLIKHQTVKSIKFMKNRMLTRRQERITELSKTNNILYKERLERFTKNFERFLGELTGPQVKLIKLHANETLKEPRIRLHNRTLRQKVFIRFLITKPTEAELTLYLNKLLLTGYLITNPGYKDFSETSLNRFRKLLIKILAISSKKQREIIIRKLRDYANDFKTVSLGGNVGDTKLQNQGSNSRDSEDSR